MDVILNEHKYAEKKHREAAEMLKQLKETETSCKTFEEDLKNAIKCTRNKYYPKIPKKSPLVRPVKPSDYLVPNRKGRKTPRHPPMPPPPRIRPTIRDATHVEVLELEEKDKRIVFECTGEI